MLAGPGVIRAASLTPAAGAMTVVLGTADTDNANATTGAVRVESLALVMLRGTYARHASSTTGRPILRVDVSMDASTTAPASVSNWQPVYLADLSAGSGVAELYVELQRVNPSTTGSTVFGSHPVNVTCGVWMRMWVGDVDTTNPGAVTNLAFGGTT
jgi:hypothetical protein